MPEVCAGGDYSATAVGGKREPGMAIVARESELDVGRAAGWAAAAGGGGSGAREGVTYGVRGLGGVGGRFPAPAGGAGPSGIGATIYP